MSEGEATTTKKCQLCGETRFGELQLFKVLGKVMCQECYHFLTKKNTKVI